MADGWVSHIGARRLWLGPAMLAVAQVLGWACVVSSAWLAVVRDWTTAATDLGVGALLLLAVADLRVLHELVVTSVPEERSDD